MAGELRYTVTGKDVSAGKTFSDVGRKAEAMGRSVRTSNANLASAGDVATKSGRAFAAYGNKLAGTGRLLKGAAIGVTAVAAAGTLFATKIGIDCVSAASDLNETVSKSQVIFGKDAASMRRWAKTAATAFGMSEEAALAGAAQFGNFFDQIKIGKKRSVEMSKSLVKLSADLGSFNNADPAEVMLAFQAATRGEYDSLQKFIPTINAAKVQTEALKESHKKSAKTLTDAEKATALYTLAVKGAGAAQGDFVRTSSGLANQQRILKAQFTDLKAAVGTAFMGIVTEMLPAIRAGLQKLQGYFLAVANWFTKDFIPNIKLVWSEWGPRLKTSLGNLTDSFGGLWLKLTGGKAATGDMRTSLENIATTADHVMGKLKSVIDYINRRFTTSQMQGFVKLVGGLALAAKTGTLSLSVKLIGIAASQIKEWLSASQLTGAATALTGAARALTLAASKPGGGGVGVGVPFGPTAPLAPKTASAKALGLAKGTLVIGTVVAAAMIVDELSGGKGKNFLKNEAGEVGRALTFSSTKEDLKNQNRVGDTLASGGFWKGARDVLYEAVTFGQLSTEKFNKDQVTGTQGKLKPVKAVKDVQTGPYNAARAAGIRTALGKNIGDLSKGGLESLIINPFIPEAAKRKFRAALENLKKQAIETSRIKDVEVKLKGELTDLNNKINAAEEALKAPGLTEPERAHIRAEITDLVAKKNTAERLLKDPSWLSPPIVKLRGNIENIEERIITAKRKLADPKLTLPEKTKIRADITDLEKRKKEAEAQLAELGRKQVKIQVSAVGVGMTMQQLGDITDIAQRLFANGNNPAAAASLARALAISRAQYPRKGGIATGGPIHGPGTGTSDSIAAWLSNGEHVLTAEEVKAAGGHGAIYRMREALTGKKPAPPVRFAEGGAALLNPKIDTQGFGLKSKLNSMIQSETARQATAGGGSVNLGSGGGSVGAILAMARRFYPGAMVSSGLRNTNDYHGRGLAADLIGGGASGMAAIARGFYAISGRLLELIHSGGGGFFVKNGQRVGANYYRSVIGQHYNHVHVAANRSAMFDSGGYLMPGTTMATNNTGKPERVLPPGASDTETISAPFVIQLDSMNVYKGMLTLRRRLGGSWELA